jgi:ketosteroid isomerase-like protein
MVQDQTDLIEEIWACELAYWRYLLAVDADGFMSIWHKAFIGWPGSMLAPIDYAEMERNVRQDFAEEDPPTTLISYDLERHSVRLFGDLAIVFYTAHTTERRRNGETVSGHGRITHTWAQTDKGWQIIAGMSAALKAGNASE